ncbi:hypothetical protein COJ85_32060 [Bacillus sp. AFS076308]|uniref:hypothetical protein n=1 Tax=unclassified Bacillus (in: firmicutes) TaxID=185979 RepID=UPI000BF413BA|nr:MULTISPECIES: hypothetical protein [unclassified Bacillus (in: firmicutes)]PFN77605.1 hypothetical protein COJ85_32060 [Bacillus sp. AFS076308]PGV45314.1 hypothetical protein COD92_30860 [Bacillus sp. AFS037270]
MATPIAHQKVKTSSSIINIPIYSINDVSYPAARVSTPNGIGYYDLVNPTNATPLRIQTAQGIKGVNLGASRNALFYFANQSGTITNSTNTGVRGGGVTVQKTTTITKVGVKGGAGGAWSLWKLDNTTFNITAKLAEGTTLSSPDASGFRLSSDISVPLSVGDNILLCFTYATGIDASGTYRYQTGTSANSDAYFIGNNRIISSTPTTGSTTGTGFTYDMILHHT